MSTQQTDHPIPNTPHGSSNTPDASSLDDGAESAGVRASGGRFSNRGLPMFGVAAAAAIVTALGMQVVRPQPALSAAEAAPAAQEKSIARVNGEAIPYDLVARECVDRYGAEVLDSIINRTLIAQACQDRGVQVTDREVAQEVAQIAEKFNLPVDSWLEMLKTERNLTQQQYYRDIIWPMLALKKLAGTDVVVTEDQMKKAFERDYGPRVKARMILVRGNIRQANKIWEQCQADPENFDKLAREHSADTNTRSLGGVIPPIQRHAGSPNVEAEAFRLSPGEVSAVVEVNAGEYVILRCEGRTDPVVTDIMDVWEDLMAAQKEEMVQSAVASTFESIEKTAEVINYHTGETRAPAVRTAAAGL